MPGLPKFSDYTSMILRGETYPQFEPRLNEKLKIFVAVHGVGTELGVDETDYLFDFETFLDTPYTSPAGWQADFREWMFTYNGLVRMDIQCGDFPMLTLPCYPAPRDFVHTYEQIIFFNTRYWDAQAENAHDWTFSVHNSDTVPIRGAVQVAMVLTDISSHYPETKQIKCLACKHINTVPLEQTKITCENCGATFFAPFFPGRTI